MKWFSVHSRGNVDGFLWDTEAETRAAVFLTPGQAKFMASFKDVRRGEALLPSPLA